MTLLPAFELPIMAILSLPDIISFSYEQQVPGNPKLTEFWMFNYRLGSMGAELCDYTRYRASKTKSTLLDTWTRDDHNNDTNTLTEAEALSRLSESQRLEIMNALRTRVRDAIEQERHMLQARLKELGQAEQWYCNKLAKAELFLYELRSNPGRVDHLKSLGYRQLWKFEEGFYWHLIESVDTDWIKCADEQEAVERLDYYLRSGVFNA
jgi:hypothetical protein